MGLIQYFLWTSLLEFVGSSPVCSYSPLLLLGLCVRGGSRSPGLPDFYCFPFHSLFPERSGQWEKCLISVDAKTWQVEYKLCFLRWHPGPFIPRNKTICCGSCFPIVLWKYPSGIRISCVCVGFCLDCSLEAALPACVFSHV